MKRKLLALLAAALLVAVAAGCGKKADESGKGNMASQEGSTGQPANPGGSNAGGSSGTPATPQNPSTPGGGGSTPPAEKVELGPLKPGEQAKVGPLTVTLKQINSATQGPPTGYVYMLVELSIQNDDAKPYTVNITDHFKAETPEGKKASYNVQATAARNPRLQGTLQKGEATTGWVGHLAKKVDGTYKYTFVHPDYGEATWTFGL